MKLCAEYERFLSDQTHVSPSTLGLLRARLGRFPDPDGLNVKWFKKRIKNVAPATVRQELGLAKRVLQFLGHDTKELSNVKTPRLTETVTVEDLYTRNELEAIFKACIHTRDRAMFEVLYESGVRASELLTMKFRNTTFHDDGTATVTVKGKTGIRQIPLYESIPVLKAWMNVHPTGKGHIWSIFKKPYNAMSAHHLYHLTRQMIDRAGFECKKKKVVHMFRHTRATELVRLGVRGQSLSKFMGWTKRSNMEAVYVHLSTEDVNNEMRSKVFGLDTEETTPRPLLSSTTCPRCQTQNEQYARFCSKCNMPFADDAIVDALEQQERKREEIEQMIQNRVKAEMERVVQAFTSAIQGIESTKTLKDLAMAFAKEINR